MSSPKVSGIGGVFFRAKDPAALAAWYRDVLGVPVSAEGGSYGTFEVGKDGRDGTGTPLMTVWSAFPSDTDYFGPRATTWMVNYRVADLDGMLAHLKVAGAWVDPRTEDYEYGRFGWAEDPEGNRFELWQPSPAGFTSEESANL